MFSPLAEYQFQVLRVTPIDILENRKHRLTWTWRFGSKWWFFWCLDFNLYWEILKTTSYFVISKAPLFLMFSRHRSYTWTHWSPENPSILADFDISRGKYFRKILEWQSAAALSHQSYLQPQYCVEISGQCSGQVLSQMIKDSSKSVYRHELDLQS